jgi:hypothetical protein
MQTFGCDLPPIDDLESKKHRPMRRRHSAYLRYLFQVEFLLGGSAQRAAVFSATPGPAVAAQELQSRSPPFF